MANKVTSKKVDLYISWRDDLLKIIGGDICNKCTDPRKNKMAINLENPLTCECRCDRVKNILASASNIDGDIQSFIKLSH